MAKRAYYRNSLIAIYMGREFGVQTKGNSTFEQYEPSTIHYIELDSMYIFEPQVGDWLSVNDIPFIVHKQTSDKYYYMFASGKLALSESSINGITITHDKKDESKIIMRNNKHFFWPEFEEEK